jgi:hypothetical protein
VLALLVAALALPCVARAQGTKTVSEGGSTRTKPQKSDERRSFGGLAVPAVYYSPETKLAAGIAGFLYFRLPGEKLEDRPSKVDGDFIYTVNKQLLLQMSPTLYIDHGRFLVETRVQLREPLRQVLGRRPEHPERGRRGLQLHARARPASGSRASSRRTRTSASRPTPKRSPSPSSTTPRGQLARNPNVLGRGGSFVTGLGFRFVYDSRDNYFFDPQRHLRGHPRHVLRRGPRRHALVLALHRRPPQVLPPLVRAHPRHPGLRRVDLLGRALQPLARARRPVPHARLLRGALPRQQRGHHAGRVPLPDRLALRRRRVRKALAWWPRASSTSS